MNIIEEIEEKEHELSLRECINSRQKLLEIEKKNNCWRVQILDKFADFLERSAIKVRTYTMSITTPCLIKTKTTNHRRTK